MSNMKMSPYRFGGRVASMPPEASLKNFALKDMVQTYCRSC